MFDFLKTVIAAEKSVSTDTTISEAHFNNKFRVRVELSLLTRLLELSREELKDDISIHKILMRIEEKATAKSTEDSDATLTVEDYDFIVQDLGSESSDKDEKKDKKEEKPEGKKEEE